MRYEQKGQRSNTSGDCETKNRNRKKPAVSGLTLEESVSVAVGFFLISVDLGAGSIQWRKTGMGSRVITWPVCIRGILRNTSLDEIKIDHTDGLFSMNWTAPDLRNYGHKFRLTFLPRTEGGFKCDPIPNQSPRRDDHLPPSLACTASASFIIDTTTTMNGHPAFVTSAGAALVPGLSRACGRGAQAHRLPARTASPASSRRSVTMAVRKFFVGGNWKCNLTKSSIGDLVGALNAGAALDASLVEVAVAPPTPYLSSTRDALRGDFAVSGQNAWMGAGGAFTGETDAAMLRDVGCDWVILGHSERRHIPELRETDACIAEKAKYALSEGLGVMYCIGELLEEREAGQTIAVCERQMSALKEAVSDWSKIVIAYEPVWAIGTGKVATPQQADEVHQALRSWIKKNMGDQVADSTRILYGGSVSPKNCAELAKLPDIDGFLVGGASLTPGFLEIVDSYKAALSAV